MSDISIEKPIPLLAVDLIKELDATVGNGIPCITDTEKEIWIKAAQRWLVDSLLMRLKVQDESLISKGITI